MKLYDFSEDRKKILVYELEGIRKEIRKYKVENSIKKFLTLETLNKDLVDMISEGKTIDISLLDEKNRLFYTKLIYDSYATDYDQVVRENLLRDYYFSRCLDFNVVQVDNGNDMFSIFSDSVLLPLDNYESIRSYNNPNTWYRFSHLLLLSESLAGLHYLEQGNFDKLLSYPVICNKTPFQLFDLSLKMQLPNRLDDDTITDILGFDNEETISESSKVLTLYRNSIKKISI